MKGTTLVSIAFCCVCSSIAMSTPDTPAFPSPSIDTSLLYTHLSAAIPQDADPSPLQRILQYLRDPTLNKLDAIIPVIMRPISVLQKIQQLQGFEG
jgi:hypothetical protein